MVGSRGVCGRSGRGVVAAVTVSILTGDCRDVMAAMQPESVDACVTDPPYHLTAGKKGGTGDASVNLDTPYGRARISTGFMNQTWDGGDIAFRPETWAAVFRVLKPGGHLLAFSGTRTQHRMVCAIEDAGFEIRDQIGWAYGSGFPKSLDVSKAIDKAAGVEREVVGMKPDPRYLSPRRNSPNHMDRARGVEGGHGDESDAATVTAPATPEAAAWQGWGTALKPAWEPICVARKPLVGTVAGNVLAHGTGALNIDGCRVETDDSGTRDGGRRPGTHEGYQRPNATMFQDKTDWSLSPAGRWPANLIHDGSDEVLACFPETASGVQRKPKGTGGIWSGISNDPCGPQYGDEGSAARFFYCAKSSRSERGEGNDHPTVKPVELMRWLVRLVTPPGGHVLDPFAGSGTTGIAADIEQMRATLIEQDPAYAEIARQRLLSEAGLFALAAE
jgi:DNA modification methylase